MPLGSLLPQPPSFKKKRNYVLHEQLGAGTFGKVIRPSSPHHQSGKKSVVSVAAQRVPIGESRDVALKVISKKKVKGNENSVWSEMNVLKGLDHKNIVSWGSVCHDSGSARKNKRLLIVASSL
jgi:calcium/calmodulin-dependent protein kinase I